MQAVLPSRIADALLAEKDAWKRYAAAKGDNWRAAFDEWAEAREAFLRASLYWRTGLFYLECQGPRQHAMYNSYRSCFMQAAELFNPKTEGRRPDRRDGRPLEIPSGGAIL